MIRVRNLREPLKGLHIETSLGIVNIYEGESDKKGRSMVTVQLIPDEVGDYRIKATPCKYVRLVRNKIKIKSK